MNQHTNISEVTREERALLIDHYIREIEKLENVIAASREKLAEYQERLEMFKDDHSSYTGKTVSGV